MATLDRSRRPRFLNGVRRGVTAVLVAMLLPVFVGFIALSVDTAIIAASRGQLLTAADAAALAGAQQLVSDRRLQGPTDLTPEMTAARSKASAFAAANSVLGSPVQLVTSSGGDVSFGYIDPSAPTAAMKTSAAFTPVFNSVQVTAARTAQRSGVVPTFFSGMLGVNGANVTVQSTATAALYQIAGFSDDLGVSAGLLPIVLDKPTYDAMMAGTTTDQYTWNPTTSRVTSGADGVAESKLYPVSNGSPGNWGTINVGVSNNSTSTLGDQIRYGITPSQLATFPNGEIKLNTSLNPPSITFGGNPGISAGIKDDLEAIIGKPVTIPIYDTNGGNGNNAWYRVIAFAGVRIVDVNFKGNPKFVIVQPAIVTDRTALTGAPQSSWTDGGKVVLHLSR